MFEEEKHKSSIVSDGAKQLKLQDSNANSLSDFFHKVHTINGLHFISAMSQIFLGTAVVALSLINSIQPVWLATIMTVFGSITTMVGLYFMYSIFTNSGTFDSLLQKAIKRVVNSQN
ncbi:hypothetical protein [Gracilimonas tropica]|uniref:hypothetical protein n=1 Tax=Gracilimonas tropica TaxID=454600 RepID=UPI0003703FE7|nr:hypothetical protein [Gracilimonas tropica]